MRNAVAVSSEQTYLGYFRAWVDARVRCGVPVILQHCRDDMANVWCLFEYVAYEFANKSIAVADHRKSFVGDQIRSPYSAPLSSTLPTPLSLAAAKALLVRTPTWETNLPCVGLFHWGCCVLARLIVELWGSGSVAYFVSLRFAS